MAYMSAISPCFGCGQVFSYNPELVPSIRDEKGVRQPVCRDCIDRANPKRIANGLEPIVPLPGAYEPQEVP
jgi:hypothetical protein